MRQFVRHFLFAALALFALSATAEERITYFVPNAQGSPVAAMDEQGNVIWRESYAPYGERITKPAANNAKTAYTGKPEDPDTGLVYMGARWYDPVAGRFGGVDPQGFKEGNPQSFGRYVYANSSPYGYVDRNGEIAETAWDVVNVAMDVESLGANVAVGNYAGAAVDGVGLIIDAAATAVPGVPGGAGTLIKLERAAEKGGEVSKRLARVVSGTTDAKTLGKPGDVDVFVTNAHELEGLDAAGIAEKLTIPKKDSFTVIEFPTDSVTGLASPINRTNPGFIGGGRTAGGATEFVVDNGPIPEGATRRLVK